MNIVKESSGLPVLFFNNLLLSKLQAAKVILTGNKGFSISNRIFVKQLDFDTVYY